MYKVIACISIMYTHGVQVSRGFVYNCGQLWCGCGGKLCMVYVVCTVLKGLELIVLRRFSV